MIARISRAADRFLDLFLENCVEAVAVLCTLVLLAIVTAIAIQARRKQIDWSWPSVLPTFFGCGLAILIMALLSALPAPDPTSMGGPPPELAKAQEFAGERFVGAPVAPPGETVNPIVQIDAPITPVSDGAAPADEAHAGAGAVSSESPFSAWVFQIHVHSSTGSTITVYVARASGELPPRDRYEGSPIASTLPIAGPGNAISPPR